MANQYQTLIQIEQETIPSIEGKIIDAFIRANNVFQDIPLITKNVLRMQGRKTRGNLPTANFRPLNKPVDSQIVTPDEYAEQCYIITQTIDIDYEAQNLENYIEDEWDYQTRENVEAVSFAINYNFINGDPTVNKDVFVGLKTRCTNYNRYQVNPNVLINAGNLNLSAGNVSAGNGVQLGIYIQALFDNMGAPDGKNIILLYNDPFKRAWDGCIKSANGGFEITEDYYDRSVEKYKMAKLRNIGRTAPVLQTGGYANQGYNISNTENTDGTDTGVGTCTSVYGIRVGDTAFRGWQKHAMKTVGPYPVPGGVFQEMALMWGLGIWAPDDRCIGRIYGINIANQ